MVKRYCDVCEKEIGRYTNYTKVKILPKIKINRCEEPFVEDETLDVCKDCMKELRTSIYNLKREWKMGYRK